MKHERKKTCGRCKGSGYVMLSNSKAQIVCKTCLGRGKIAAGSRPDGRR